MMSRGGRRLIGAVLHTLLFLRGVVRRLERLHRYGALRCGDAQKVLPVALADDGSAQGALWFQWFALDSSANKK
jgi:hypothetical protein